ncbi:MAG: DsbA family protein [Burkholderiaceae bacterium]
MSIKSLLMPAITARLLSRQRLLAHRARAERQRITRGEPHCLHYFHQVDDPYSALLAQVLPRLLARYDVQLEAHVVAAPADDAAPEREKLVAYSRKDAQLLARHWQLDFTDTATQPAIDACTRARRQLVSACATGRFAEFAAPVTLQLWNPALVLPPDAPTPADATSTHRHIADSEALRKRLGHYLGAMLFYAGEWYWGVDRLHHLETRLQQLGAQRDGVNDLMFPPPAELQQPTPVRETSVIDFFVSLRSPYSAIAAPRLFALAALTGAKVRLRPVLPMVMRGLAVPRNKRLYIVQDTAREAFVRKIPFGRLNDPLGRPTERGLALLALAQRHGRGQALLLSFMQGVWSEGIDAGRNSGLRRIAERAGLSWDDARRALEDESWRQEAEANRAAMFTLGLWGVPSFQVRDVAVWGQDRLWAVQQAVLQTR